MDRFNGVNDLLILPKILEGVVATVSWQAAIGLGGADEVEGDERCISVIREECRGEESLGGRGRIRWEEIESVGRSKLFLRRQRST